MLCPVYRQRLPARTQVYLNDLSFLKCIGKGGSSEVYLGNWIMLRDESFFYFYRLSIGYEIEGKNLPYYLYKSIT